MSDWKKQADELVGKLRNVDRDFAQKRDSGASVQETPVFVSGSLFLNSYAASLRLNEVNVVMSVERGRVGLRVGDRVWDIRNERFTNEWSARCESTFIEVQFESLSFGADENTYFSPKLIRLNGEIIGTCRYERGVNHCHVVSSSASLQSFTVKREWRESLLEQGIRAQILCVGTLDTTSTVVAMLLVRDPVMSLGLT